MQTFRTVFSCDHVIDELVSENAWYNGEYLGEDTVKLIDAGAIVNVFLVYQMIDGVTIGYYEDQDFVVSDDRMGIVWTNKKPVSGANLFAELIIRIKRYHVYELGECPRCNGNGWFLSVFGDAYKDKIYAVTGTDKLVQEFIKILYTKTLPTGYGTELLNLPGNIYRNVGELYEKFSSVIMSAESQYKNMQAENQSQRELGELLEAATIVSLEYDENSQTLYSGIALIAQSGDGVEFAVTV